MPEKAEFKDETDGEESESEQFNENDFRCGVFSWRPKWLQMFTKPVYFAVMNLFFAIFQGAMKTGLGASMTTIERKFGMSGKMISIVMIMDNITGTIASLLIGYYATKISRPRILVFGVWLSVASCFFFILPHILYSQVEVTGNISPTSTKRGVSKLFTQFCRSNQTLQNALSVEPPQEISVAYPVLVCLSLGNMLNGMGGTSFYIAGTTYTDDNVKKKNTPIYFGVMMAIRMVGPLLGIFVNSYFLTVYEHPGRTPPPGITTQDPRWIGAWWLPFIFWGSLMMIVSVPLLLFPKHIRRQAAMIHKSKLPKTNDEPSSLWEKIKADCKDFAMGVKRLAKNRVYTWKIIGIIFIINGFGGYVMNLPKYIEMQYRVSASKASFLTGSTKILAVIIATFLSGIVVKIFKPSARSVCLFCVIADLLNISVLISAIFLTCDNWKLTGSHLSDKGVLSLTNTCNENCFCKTKFEPFCDLSANKSYASPCFGGCVGTNLTNMHCKCLEPPNDDTTSLLWKGATQFASGFCRNDCNNLMIFLLITTIAKFISSLPRVGNSLITLRSVDPADKALAMGFMSFAFNVFGFIPYPLVYGAIFDSTCVLWGERNGEKSNCWYYDNDLLRQRYLSTTIGFYSVGIVCIMLVWYFAKDVKNMYIEDDDDPKKEFKMEQVNNSHKNKDGMPNVHTKLILNE